MRSRTCGGGSGFKVRPEPPASSLARGVYRSQNLSGAPSLAVTPAQPATAVAVLALGLRHHQLAVLTATLLQALLGARRLGLQEPSLDAANCFERLRRQ